MGTAALSPLVKSDFLLRDEGSIVLLTPCSEAAREWVDENIGQDNGYQPYFPTVVIEHRFIFQILDAIKDTGLAVRL